MHRVPLTLALSLLLAGSSASPAATKLPDAPSATLAGGREPVPGVTPGRAGLVFASPAGDRGAEAGSDSLAWNPPPLDLPAPQAAGSGHPARHGDAGRAGPGDVDANGQPIPLERQQPQRILGFMPNFRSVSGGSVPHPPGWKYNFHVATRQAFDYSSFIFLGITSLSAEAIDSHPALGKGVGGFYAYTWRGLLDKTDGTYLQAWLLPSLLHEDTRYYALGHGSILHRSLYVISRQAVTRTYGGRDTPNIAGLGGKVLTQYISRFYYPAGSSDFGVLATKFGYAAMRDIGFSSIREFYPTVAAHYINKHRAKIAAQSAHDATP